MHIVIMGCGRVGSTLSHILEDRDNTVSVIDRDPEAFRRLGSAFKGDRVTGVGFDRAVLIQAGIERADAFASDPARIRSLVREAEQRRHSYLEGRFGAEGAQQIERSNTKLFSKDT